MTVEYLFALSGALILAGMIRGPSFADRSLALSALVNVAVVFLLLSSVKSGSGLFMDVSVAIIFMSFVGTIAIARYARRKS